MKIIKIDTKMYKDCTLGRLSIEDFHCFTLELPWLDNKNKISCLAEGTYLARVRESSRNGTVIELLYTGSRTYIQVHAGNFTEDIEGCILVGKSIKDINLDGTPDVTSSKSTLKKLLKKVIGGNRFWVQINRT